MNLILKGRGVDLNDRLRGYADEKLTRVQRFFERIIKMEVELSHESTARASDRHRVEVTVKTPGETLRAHGGGTDFFAAIDQAADHLETQVKKLKSRFNHRPHRTAPGANAHAVAPEAVDEDGNRRVVRTSGSFVKPVSTEEAIMELESRGLQFLLFTDAETMRAGVIYRRSDGAYGLIEHT